VTVRQPSSGGCGRSSPLRPDLRSGHRCRSGARRPAACSRTHDSELRSGRRDGGTVADGEPFVPQTRFATLPTLKAQAQRPNNGSGFVPGTGLRRVTDPRTSDGLCPMSFVVHLLFEGRSSWVIRRSPNEPPVEPARDRAWAHVERRETTRRQITKPAGQLRGHVLTAGRQFIGFRTAVAHRQQAPPPLPWLLP
jgi:hypothetical protein